MAKIDGSTYISNRCMTCPTYSICVIESTPKCGIIDYEEYQYIDFNCLTNTDLKNMVREYENGKYYANTIITQRACKALKDRGYTGALPF